MLKKILKFTVGFFLLSILVLVIYLGVKFCQYKVALGEKPNDKKVQELIDEALSYFPEKLPPDDQNRIVAYTQIKKTAYQYGDDVSEDYTIDDDAFTLLHEDATKEVYDRFRKSKSIYQKIVTATQKPQVVLPLDNPGIQTGLDPFIKNMKTVVENVSSMMDIDSYTLAYCNLLAHDENWIEVSACLQTHEIILEDMLTHPASILSLRVAKKSFQQHKEIMQSLSRLEIIKNGEMTTPVFKEMPGERNLLREASLVAFVNFYYASQKDQAWSLIKEFISGNYYPKKPEFFADVIVQCTLSIDQNYAVKDILVIDAILKKNTSSISDEDQSVLLKILKQNPRPLERPWLYTRKSLHSMVSEFLGDEP